ncbi:MAG: hypothetical protein JNM34_06240 [Chthonomonadaceae bacterium]|nr:hypothetical protein [Chthonomonadaceae bacterium]
MSSTSAEPFRRELATTVEPVVGKETEFEKPRGINRVEIRRGFVTVHVSTRSRIEVLRAMSQAGVSLDFLKLTQSGMSFVVPESLGTKVATELEGFQFELKEGRCIVLAFAANMRDEEGLIARVVSEVIGTGCEVDHLGDMHDRVLLVIKSDEVDGVAARLTDRLVEA